MMKNAKGDDNDMKGWGSVGVSILDELLEPIRQIIENPIFSISNMPVVPVPAL